MNSEPQANSETSAGVEPVVDAPAAVAQAVGATRRQLRVVGLIAVAALLLNGWLWLRLITAQELLQRQGADAGASAAEARTLARQAQEQERELAAKLAVMEARLGEVALQRGQLDELMQSLSRSRDENLVVDIESAIRLAQQQTQMVGSVEPLLAALRGAELRVQRMPQARLAPVQRALARDIARVKAAPVIDTPSLLARLDELTRLVDELPMANAVGPANMGARPAAPAASTEDPAAWWQRGWNAMVDELRGLVRVRRIDSPEAVLLTPEQSFFARENLKLLLLNARLGLLARQPDAARADLVRAGVALQKYFDVNARVTRGAAGLLQQLQGQMKNVEPPRVDDTLAALATAAAGR